MICKHTTIASLIPTLAPCLLACLIIPGVTWAAFWIDDYTGTQEEYRLVRQGVELKVASQMLLKTGDELSVLNDTGKLQLLQEEASSNVK